MERRIFILLIASVLYFSSCQKDGVLPAVKPVDGSQTINNQIPGLNKDTTGTGSGTNQTTPPANPGVVTNIIQGGYLRVQMAKDPVNTDGIIVSFNPNASSAYVNSEDAPTLQGFGQVSLSSLSSDNVALAINALPLPAQRCSIPLKVDAQSDGTYTLNITSITALPAIFEVWLKDNYKKDSLDFRSNSSYTFDLYKAIPASYGSGRFSLVISQNKALNVHLLNFTAVKANGTAKIAWQTENEVNYTGFSIERSTDNGKTFTSITHSVSSGIANYSFVDKSPIKGTDQYRLIVTDLNGALIYSSAIPLSF